jgi:hypothetical protein
MAWPWSKKKPPKTREELLDELKAGALKEIDENNKRIRESLERIDAARNPSSKESK